MQPPGDSIGYAPTTQHADPDASFDLFYQVVKDKLQNTAVLTGTQDWTPEYVQYWV